MEQIWYSPTHDQLFIVLRMTPDLCIFYTEDGSGYPLSVEVIKIHFTYVVDL